MKEVVPMETLKDFFEKNEIDQTESLDEKNFGSVYKTINKATKEVWAAKISEIHPNFDKGLFKERYEQANSLEHPNLMPYPANYRFTEGMITTIALMPLLPLGNLNDQLHLDRGDKKLIADQVLDGLYYLHAQEVVWQNLSARHIVLHKEFGNYIPWFINYGNKSKIPLAFFSDYEYLAPEQFKDRANINVQTDLWAYGVLLYKLWTGRLPFGEKSASLSNAKIQDRITGAEDWSLGLMGEIPQPYQKIVEKCLKKEKEARWANCGEIIAVIKNWVPPVQTAIVWEEEAETETRRFLRKPNKPIVWWQVVLLFVAAGLLGYYLG
jgi:serine/threonine protein kinase